MLLQRDIQRITIGFQIDDSRGIRVYGTNSYLHGKEIVDVKAKISYSMYFEFPANFREGKYSLGFSIHEGENHTEGSYLWKDSIPHLPTKRSGALR